MIQAEVIIIYVTVGIIFIVSLILSYLIFFNQGIYDKETGRFKSGFNIPGLDGKPGDEIDHFGFRRFMGITTLLMFIIMSLIIIISIRFFPETPNSKNEFVWTMRFITALFIGLLIPMIFMFSGYKEKYIKRVNSTKPVHHKYILIGITIFLFIIWISIYLIGIKFI